MKTKKPERVSWEEWRKQYRSKENFNTIESHMVADMLLSSMHMQMSEVIDYLEKENEALRARIDELKEYKWKYEELCK